MVCCSYHMGYLPWVGLTGTLRSAVPMTWDSYHEWGWQVHYDQLFLSHEIFTMSQADRDITVCCSYHMEYLPWVGLTGTLRSVVPITWNTYHESGWQVHYDQLFLSHEIFTMSQADRDITVCCSYHMEYLPWVGLIGTLRSAVPITWDIYHEWDWQGHYGQLFLSHGILTMSGSDRNIMVNCSYDIRYLPWVGLMGTLRSAVPITWDTEHESGWQGQYGLLFLSHGILTMSRADRYITISCSYHMRYLPWVGLTGTSQSAVPITWDTYHKWGWQGYYGQLFLSHEILTMSGTERDITVSCSYHMGYLPWVRLRETLRSPVPITWDI